MPKLPEEIAAATFAKIDSQGYDPAEVDDFLREVATDYATVIEMIGDVQGGPSSTDMRQQVNSILHDAEALAEALMERTREEVAATKEAAKGTARSIVSEADEVRQGVHEAAAQWAKVATEAQEHAFDLAAQTVAHCKLLLKEAEARVEQLNSYKYDLSQHLIEIDRLAQGPKVEVDAVRGRA